MLELGSSGSVRGVSSNAHPYRDPRPTPAIHDRRRGGSKPLSTERRLNLPRQ